MTCQTVIIGLARQCSAAGVRQLLQAEGVGRESRRTATDGTLEHTLPAGIVDVELLVAADIGLDETVELIVRERGRGVIVCSTGDVAPGVVTGAVRSGGAAFAGAGGSQRVDPTQLVRLTVAVEILLIAALPIDWSLPDLTEISIGKRSRVACAADGIAQRARAAGATARSWLRTAIAGPGHAVLLIVTEILRLRTT